MGFSGSNPEAPLCWRKSLCTSLLVLQKCRKALCATGGTSQASAPEVGLVKEARGNSSDESTQRARSVGGGCRELGEDMGEGR